MWLGNNALPDYALANINSWIALNPDYETICWFSSDSIGQSLTATLSKNNVNVVNVCDQTHFINYSLIKEFLDGNNNLAAADILKVELMVHCGGYYFDLGITPIIPIDRAVSTAANALCDITTLSHFEIKNSKPGLRNLTNGEYHFHASIQEGELYTTAQALQTALFKKIKLYPNLFNVLFSQNKELQYQATKNATGLTVFLAIDCLMIKHKNKNAFFTVFPVSKIGKPKDRLAYRALSLMERFALQGFTKEFFPLSLSFLNIPAPMLVKIQTLGFFKPKLTPHDHLLQELKKMDKIPIDKLGHIIQQINKKEYDLALRKACANGYCDIIEVIDKYREPLEIDYTKKSSNGKSAWNWLETSSASDENKERFRLTLDVSVSQKEKSEIQVK